MTNVELIATTTTHQIYFYGLQLSGRRRACASDEVLDLPADRGAVSLEQVLWFVAAGVSVAVIASLLWGQIRDKADDPINTPVSP